jgi:toxin ParE1/3/4
MIYTVLYTPEAQEQLLELYRYISERGSPLTAARYTDAIATTCESLSSFALRGTLREDIRPGLRITHHKVASLSKLFTILLRIMFDVDKLCPIG